MRLIMPAAVLVLMLSGCDDTTGQKPKTQVTGGVYHMMAHYLEPAADKIWGSAGLSSPRMERSTCSQPPMTVGLR